jgi:hypothetical protein
MPDEQPWQRHQRERWTRPDAHLWVRPDSGRFFLPGTDLADIFPHLARQRDMERAAEAKAIARELEELAALQDELMEIKAELARRRREDETKYSPTQPRVPAGNPRGGQWTDRSRGGGGGGVSFGGIGGGDDTGTEDGGGTRGSGVEGDGIDDGDTDSENLSDFIVKVAADDSDRRYSVNLREEEVRGHALDEHSGKSDLELETEFKRRGYDTPYVSFVPKRLGSFASDESANDLVNRTLERNKATVDMVASGELKDAFITSRFGFITGREIFRPDPTERHYYFRPTYGVGVDIRHDPDRSRVTASIPPIRETTNRSRGRHDGYS